MSFVLLPASRVLFLVEQAIRDLNAERARRCDMVRERARRSIRGRLLAWIRRRPLTDREAWRRGDAAERYLAATFAEDERETALRLLDAAREALAQADPPVVYVDVDDLAEVLPGDRPFPRAGEVTAG